MRRCRRTTSRAATRTPPSAGSLVATDVDNQSLTYSLRDAGRRTAPSRSTRTAATATSRMPTTTAGQLHLPGLRRRDQQQRDRRPGGQRGQRRAGQHRAGHALGRGRGWPSRSPDSRSPTSMPAPARSPTTLSVAHGMLTIGGAGGAAIDDNGTDASRSPARSRRSTRRWPATTWSTAPTPASSAPTR